MPLIYHMIRRLFYIHVKINTNFAPFHSPRRPQEKTNNMMKKHRRELPKEKKREYLHRGLNSGPRACEARVIPLDHASINNTPIRDEEAGSNIYSAPLSEITHVIVHVSIPSTCNVIEENTHNTIFHFCGMNVPKPHTSD